MILKANDFLARLKYYFDELLHVSPGLYLSGQLEISSDKQSWL